MKHSPELELRVAHLSPTYFSTNSVVGGGERYVFNLASALKASNPTGDFSQAIFVLGESDGLFAHDDIPVRVLRNENPSSNLMNGSSAQLWRELGSFDLLHVHQSLTFFGGYACVLARSLRKTLIVTDLGGGDNSVMTSGKGIALADGIISISLYAHSLVVGTFAGPAEIVVGPIDTQSFAPSATPLNANSVALCVSRIMPHKGIDQVVRQLPEGLKLRIVGRSYDDVYCALLHELARGKNVEFIHDADDNRLREIYREATVFVQASTFLDCYGKRHPKPELMGLAPLEALSSGIPIIVSSVASLPELAMEPAFSRTFSSEAELGAALRDVAHGVWPHHCSSRLARRFAMNNFGYQSVGQRVSRFYSRVHRSRSATCPA